MIIALTIAACILGLVGFVAGVTALLYAIGIAAAADEETQR